VQDDEVSDNDGHGLEETCDGVKWGCSHGGEDGWGCCRGTRDGLEEGGKRGSDCSISGDTVNAILWTPLLTLIVIFVI
jgi:hypothetical protein